MSNKKLRELVEGHVPGFSLILYVFAIIEFAILIICVLFSSNQDVIKIYSPDNEIVYENTYNLSHITEFKKVYGIDNFKEEGFTLTRVEKENKFPTRAWIALSICTPLALTLFMVFIVRVFEDVFHSKKEDQNDPTGSPTSDFEETRFEKLFSTLGRLNIYSLGCTAILIGFLFWMVPDLLLYVGKISYQTLFELKWVLLGLVVSLGTYMTLKMVLSHKTKTEIIRQQADIQKNRDKLAIEAKFERELLEEKPTQSTHLE